MNVKVYCLSVAFWAFPLSFVEADERQIAFVSGEQEGGRVRKSALGKSDIASYRISLGYQTVLLSQGISLSGEKRLSRSATVRIGAMRETVFNPFPSSEVYLSSDAHLYTGTVGASYFLGLSTNLLEVSSDIGMGVGRISSGDDESERFVGTVTARVGYRYQPPKGGFSARLGLGAVSYASNSRVSRPSPHVYATLGLRFKGFAKSQ